MRYLFLLLFCLFFATKSDECLRLCVVHLATPYYTFNNNLLDLNPQYCTHLIIHPYQQKILNHKRLGKALLSLRDSKYYLPNLKVLLLVKYNDLTINKTDNPQLWKIYQKLDGFYFNFREENFINKQFYSLETINEKKDFLSKTLKHFRQNFGNKIIVTTIGPRYARQGIYDFKVFNETIDYFAIDSDQSLLDKHMPNFSTSQLNLAYNATLEYLAKTLMKNGISKSKLLIYADGPSYTEESRIRVIWSSLNKFPGVLIDNMQNFNNREYRPNKMNDDISKLEKLHICPSSSDDSDNVEKKKTVKKLTCYYSLKEDDNDYLKFSEEKYQKCDRIIFHKITTNHTDYISTEKLKKIIRHFKNFNLTETSLILSIDFDYNKIKKAVFGLESFEQFAGIVSLQIENIIEKYDLDGIEYICADSMNSELLQKIISSIRNTVKKEIEIGLQVNVFKAQELVEVINDNNISWVTHKINPLGDPALAIFYQWNELHRNNDLDLEKVVIKFSPAIWQENAIFSFPGKLKINEEQNPEDDLLLNRKYLCLNETIKKNLPDSNAFFNLPIVFTIPEDVEKSKEKMLQRLDDPQLLLAVISFNGKPLPHDKYYLRFETKELIEYKIKVAEKYGFGGGFALASINDDDFEGICGGTSMFDELIKIIK